MSIRVRCNQCQQAYKLTKLRDEPSIRCKKCGNEIELPVEAVVPNHCSHLACPACESTRLQERRRKVESKEITCHSCGSCRGTWLDGGDLFVLTGQSEASRQAVAALKWDSIETQRMCPRCHHPMLEGKSLDDAPHVDYCGECDGLWFDAIELKTLLRHLKLAEQSDSPKDWLSESDQSRLPPRISSRKRQSSANHNEEENNSLFNRLLLLYTVLPLVVFLSIGTSAAKMFGWRGFVAAFVVVALVSAFAFLRLYLQLKFDPFDRICAMRGSGKAGQAGGEISGLDSMASKRKRQVERREVLAFWLMLIGFLMTAGFLSLIAVYASQDSPSRVAMCVAAAVGAGAFLCGWVITLMQARLCPECHQGRLRPIASRDAGTINTAHYDNRNVRYRRKLVAQYYDCDKCGHRVWIEH